MLHSFGTIRFLNNHIGKNVMLYLYNCRMCKLYSICAYNFPTTINQHFFRFNWIVSQQRLPRYGAEPYAQCVYSIKNGSPKHFLKYYTHFLYSNLDAQQRQ